MTMLPKKIPAHMPAPATAAVVSHSVGSAGWKLPRISPPIIPRTRPDTAPKAVKIRRTINLAATRSCFVTGMTSAYFSHFDMLSKEKVVMTIMLHSTQEVVI